MQTVFIASIWGCDEIRRNKPTPQKEALGGIAIIESVLWDAVPSYFRKLDSQLRISLGQRLPIDAVPIKFASWIGTYTRYLVFGFLLMYFCSKLIR